MRVLTHHLDGLGCFSYVVVDDDAGEAVVIDPQLEIAEYLDEAREEAFEIVHVVDTHLHADHVSGGRALAAATGAPYWLPASAEAPFAHEPLREGAELIVGGVALRAIRTPGHTPEHMSLELLDATRGREPFALFTGDTLFVGGVGRPDLVGTTGAETLAGLLHESVTRTLGARDGDVLVYPGHGAGSACGADMAPQPVTTLGFEKRTNAYFRKPSRDAFVREVTKDLPPKPGNAKRIKGINANGPPVTVPTGEVPRLAPREFAREADGGALVIDGRSPDAFAANHVERSVNVPRAESSFSSRAAHFLEWGLPVLLVLDDERDARQATIALARVGGLDVRGVLAGGIAAWRMAGLAFETIPTLDATEAERASREGKRRLLDVRSASEWRAGHAPGATHAPWESLVHRPPIDRDIPWSVICGSGSRSGMASSVLRREGYDVANVLGGMAAWREADLPLEKGAAVARLR